MITNDKISKTTVSFVSGRGGVGKTVISLSLAKCLSSLGGKRVLLIDFDLATNGASHFFRYELEEKKNKESQSQKGIVELLDVLLKECKFQQQREKIVKLLDGLASDDEDKIQQQKEEIVKLLDELVNHKIDKNQQMRELIIALIDELVGSKQENKKDRREKIVELLDKLVSGNVEELIKVEELVKSNLLFIKAEKKGEFDFIPSTIFSAKNRLDYASLSEYSPYFHPLIDSIVKIWGQNYDFILVDSQAGANPCSCSVVQSSDKVVFVVHPDPLCIGATYILAGTFNNILAFKNILAQKNAFCLYNFLQLEESQNPYSEIELPEFRNLRPLPYDEEVYNTLKRGARFKITEQSLANLKSEGVPDDVLEKLQSLKNQEVIVEEEFLDILNRTIGDEQTVRFKSLFLKHAKRGEIPFDENNPTAFSLGIIRLVDNLFDVGLEQQYRDAVEEELKKIKSKLDSFWKGLTNIFIGILIVIFLLLGGVYISAFFLKEKISGIFLATILIGINAFCLLTSIWLAIESIRGPDAISEEAIFRLKAEQRKFQTLKNTMEITDIDTTTKSRTGV